MSERGKVEHSACGRDAITKIGIAERSLVTFTVGAGFGPSGFPLFPFSWDEARVCGDNLLSSCQEIQEWQEGIFQKERGEKRGV